MSSPRVMSYPRTLPICLRRSTNFHTTPPCCNYLSQERSPSNVTGRELCFVAFGQPDVVGHGDGNVLASIAPCINCLFRRRADRFIKRVLRYCDVTCRYLHTSPSAFYRTGIMSRRDCSSLCRDAELILSRDGAHTRTHPCLYRSCMRHSEQ